MNDVLKTVNTAIVSGRGTGLEEKDDEDMTHDDWIAYHAVYILRKTRMHEMDYLTWMTQKAVRCGLAGDIAADIRDCGLRRNRVCDSIICSSPGSVVENVSKIPKAQLAAVGI